MIRVCVLTYRRAPSGVAAHTAHLAGERSELLQIVREVEN
jgi:hypothetical protein